MSIPRTLQPVQDTWDLNPLYSDISAWTQDFNEESKTDYEALSTPYRAAKSLSAKNLRSLFDLYYSLDRRLRKLYTWAHLFHDQDIANDDGKQALQKVMVRYHTFSESFSWMEPKILSHSLEKISSFMESKALEPYKIIIERLLRLKPHTLPEELEAIMAMSHRAMDASHKAFSAINDADFHFNDVSDSTGKLHPLTHATYGVLLRNPDRCLRKNAFETLHGKYKEYENTLAELLNGELQSHYFEAKARKYDSCLEAALFPNNIPTAVYRSLIKTVRSHIHVLHRYVSLKKKSLGISQFQPWDLYIPITPEVHPSYTYDQAAELTLQACRPLGSAYVERLAQGLTASRWVDKFENLNKRSGAYSSGCYDSPPYMLMNFKNLLRDAFTLAHEAGHSMHSDLSRRQPYHYSDYAIFVAEVASTFNEELLSLELLQRGAGSPAAQASIINEKLEDFRATLFRQTMFAEFELFLHERIENGDPITPKILTEKFLELNRFYYGSDLEIPEILGIEWARIPHFYYNFYVYQYATGISAASALAKKVTEGGPKEQNDYLTFLQSGSSLFPIDLLAGAGVDMKSGEAVTLSLQRFSALLDQLESLLLKS
jgi:oligoendopeptidase F